MDHFKKIFENYQSIRSFYVKKNQFKEEPITESINSSKIIAEGLESARKLKSYRSYIEEKPLKFQKKVKEILTAKNN